MFSIPSISEVLRKMSENPHVSPHSTDLGPEGGVSRLGGTSKFAEIIMKRNYMGGSIKRDSRNSPVKTEYALATEC